MDNFEINESQFLEKKCFNVILNEEEDNQEYLKEDSDNILIILKKGDDFMIDCYTGEYLQNILEDPTKGRYPCLEINKNTGRPLFTLNEKGEEINFPLNVLGFADTDNLYYKIDLSFGSFYLSEKDIKDMISSGNRIFYLDNDKIEKYKYSTSKGVYDDQKSGRGGSVVSADHCQKGTDFVVYKIKICGGEECLPQIFRQLNFILTDLNWKITQNPYQKFSEENLEETITIKPGPVTTISIGLPVSSEYNEFETITIDSKTTLENILIEIYNFYNEFSISHEDVETYEETDELDEVLSELDDDKLVYRKSLLGNKINFKGLKKDGDIWIVILEK
jgi:hypothetical protein